MNLSNTLTSLMVLMFFTSPSIVIADMEKPNVSAQLTNLENQISRVPFTQPAVDFAVWLDYNQTLEKVSLEKIKNWQFELNSIKPAPGCQEIRHSNIKLTLNLLKNRTQLLVALSEKVNYNGVISELPNGEQWYLHWLNSWLLMESEQPVNEQNIEQLKTIANKELNLVHPQYVELQTAIARDQSKVFLQSDHKLIIQEFRKREQIVKVNLSAIFGVIPTIPTVNIAASTLPDDFPAPGIYNGYNKTFYYHFTEEELLSESLDWLFLHEAIPGHHMQLYISQAAPLCPGSHLIPAPMVTAEGWAAYVETLGQQLGLLQDPASLAYVYEWRILRALRMLIDIGVHYETWSDEKALRLWQEYLPERMEIGKRELARIKRWPVQAITYVYGKYRVEELVSHFTSLSSDESRHSEVKIKNIMLRLSNHPPLTERNVGHFLGERTQ